MDGQKRGRQITRVLKIGPFEVTADSNQYTLRRNGKTAGYFVTLEGVLLQIVKDAPKTKACKTAREVIAVIRDAEKNVTEALRKANIKRKRVDA